MFSDFAKQQIIIKFENFKIYIKKGQLTTISFESAPVDPFSNYTVDALEKVLVTFIKDSFFRFSSHIIHR